MRNMLLHWIPYRHLQCCGYRPFRIPYNLMACISPELVSDRQDCALDRRHCIFFLASKASHSFRSTSPDPGIRRPRHSESQGSISSSISFCASGLPSLFTTTGIAIHKERFSFLKTYQCNSQCRKQLLRCKPATTPLMPSSARCSQSAVPVIALTCPG